MRKEIRVGIFGLGTVGTGVCRLLSESQSIIKKQTGVPVRIVKAVVANINKKRNTDLSTIELSCRPESILEDPSIDVVIELMGGLDLAEKVILSALQTGKSIVTANKELLAKKAMSILSAASQSPGWFGYEASVGSGIPIIRSLRTGFSAENILEITGILNSTSNYILTSMTHRGTSYNDALLEAQKKGLLEPNPEFDVKGYDTAHKLVVLINLAFDGIFNFNDLYVEGITAISDTDINKAIINGCTIKLVGYAKKTKNGVAAGVYPALLPNDHFLSFINGATNAISIKTANSGTYIFQGLGGGAYPAATGVLSDVVEACQFMLAGGKHPLSLFAGSTEKYLPLKAVPVDRDKCEFYLNRPA